MRIPQIQGQHKIRDTRICRLWVEDLKSCEEIAEMFGVTPRRIWQIVYKNRHFIKSDKEWESTKRKRWLKIQIKKTGDSGKDSADLVEQLRREETESKPLIDNSQHYHITIEKKKEYAESLRNILTKSRVD